MPADFVRLSRLLSLSAGNRAITDIGAAGTDFDASGGLTLASGLTLGGILNANSQAASNIFEVLASLYLGSFPWVPDLTGWTPVVTGSGVTNQVLTYLRVRTMATPASSALLYSTGGLRGFNPDVAANAYFSYAKKFLLSLWISRLADTEATMYVQIKVANTHGALAGLGVGILADTTMALYGESYGAGGAQATVNLNSNLTTNRPRKIGILFDPDTPKIEWYVDGVLKGTQSTANNIPTGVGTAPSLNISIGRPGGSVGTAETEAYAGAITLLQKL